MIKLNRSSLTLGLILASGMALANVASASTPSNAKAFSSTELAQGYAQASSDSAPKEAEGKCGEGKCGSAGE